MPIRYIDKVCKCGATLIRVAPNRKLCDECRTINRRAVQKNQRSKPDQKERIARYRKRYYAEHKTVEDEQHRAWMQANAEQQHLYRISRRDHWKIKARLYRSASPEKYMQTAKRYRERHRELLRIRAHDRYWGNPERSRELMRLRRKAANGDMTSKIKLAKLTGKMKHCTRLHLSAMNLPCGQYPSCFKCHSCPTTGVTLCKSAWRTI